MKTIKRAEGSKSGHLRKLALPFLMLITIAGFGIQNLYNASLSPAAVPIAKSVTVKDNRDQRPDLQNFPETANESVLKRQNKIVATGCPDIGGNQDKPKDPKDLYPHNNGGDIGGQSVPRSGPGFPSSFLTDCTVYLDRIGQPTLNNPLGIEIGGSRIPRDSDPLRPFAGH